MGGAIIRGLVSSGTISATKIIATCRNAGHLACLSADCPGIVTTTENQRALDEADVVFITLKPQVIPDVLPQLKFSPRHTVISVASGISLAVLEHLCRPAVRIIRVMPNTPSLIRKGVLSVTPNRHVPEAEVVAVERLLSTLGTVVRVTEAQIKAVIATAGSAPAFVFTFIEALADVGVRHGLPRATALKCATATVEGSGAMAMLTGTHPAILRDQVCSPGGNTIAGVEAMEKNGFRGSPSLGLVVLVCLLLRQAMNIDGCLYSSRWGCGSMYGFICVLGCVPAYCLACIRRRSSTPGVFAAGDAAANHVFRD